MSGGNEMRELLLTLKSKGKTILLASHAAEDIEVLCDKVFEMEMSVCTPRNDAQKIK